MRRCPEFRPGVGSISRSHSASPGARMLLTTRARSLTGKFRQLFEELRITSFASYPATGWPTPAMTPAHLHIALEWTSVDGSGADASDITRVSTPSPFRKPTCPILPPAGGTVQAASGRRHDLPATGPGRPRWTISFSFRIRGADFGQMIVPGMHWADVGSCSSS